MGLELFIKQIRSLGRKVPFNRLRHARLSHLLAEMFLEGYPKGLIITLNEEELEGNLTLKELSKKRWMVTKPDKGLTWGLEITGDTFIKKAASYNIFNHQKSILEIGIGGGRLLKAVLDLNILFKRYVGIDTSAENINFLKDQLKGEKFSFIRGDAESIHLDEKFDIVLSSLTFKHFFPSFKKCLFNVAKYMNHNAIIFFDLREGNLKYFEPDGTYIHRYTRSEVCKILEECGFRLIRFDSVTHAKGYERLLVIAKLDKTA